MKPVLIVGILIAYLGNIYAQTIPSNPVVSVTYDVEITTYKTVPQNTNLALLSDQEKVTFKKRKQVKKVRKYLSAQNEISTVIEYISREGYDGVTAGPLKKIIVDKNGAFQYNANNQLISSAPLSPKEAATRNMIKSNMSPEKFEVIGDFTPLTSEKIQQYQSNGYQVISTSTKIVLKKDTEQFTYDTSRKMLETKLYSGGKPTYTQQTFYTVNASGKKIPSLKIGTSYEVSQSGIVIENVEVEKITNYSRISVNP